MSKSSRPLVHPRRWRALIVALLLALTAAHPAAAQLFSDPVEDNGTWTVTGNAVFFLSGAVAGISPTAGLDLIHVQNLGGREATKSFTGLTLGIGTYTVTFDIGNFNNAPFAVFDLSLTGLTAGGTTLAASSSNSPTPASGTVLSWSRDYVIAAGDPRTGQTLGFRLSAPNTGADRNASFDNLRISVVPEPSSVFFMITGLGGLIFLRKILRLS